MAYQDSDRGLNGNVTYGVSSRRPFGSLLLGSAVLTLGPLAACSPASHAARPSDIRPGDTISINAGVV